MNPIKSLVHTGIELLGVNKLARYLTRHQSRILMYHRIIDHPLIPAITPAQFDKQMAYLAKHFNVMPVEELLERRKSNNLKDNSIAITFDDGHFDFYENAWPLLKKYNLPATLYVTTGFLDGSCWLWPDLIKHILITTKCNQVIHSGQRICLDRYNTLEVWSKIASDCLLMSNEDRSSYIEMLSQQLEVKPAPHASGAFKSVTWEQLREMVNEGLDVGSHTVNHFILSKLSGSKIMSEFLVSKTKIESKLKIQISGICYPNGTEFDINRNLERHCIDSGYKYGLVAYQNTNTNYFYTGRTPAPSSQSELRSIVNGYRKSK